MFSWLKLEDVNGLLMAANKKLLYDPTRDVDRTLPGKELARAA